ncbi:MAG: hypothetical protein ACLR78_03340 [Roseburia sp.]
MIRHEREKGSRGVYEFEAFALNELCQFSGAFCNSLHCDEMGHLCRVPYKIGKVKGNREKKEECEETEKLISRTESTVKDANDEHSTDKPKEDDEERMYDPDGYLCGATGLWTLRTVSAAKGRNHPFEACGARKLCRFYGKGYPEPEDSSGYP